MKVAVILLLLVCSSLLTRSVTGAQINFIPGDASFVGIVSKDSAFLRGEDVIRAVSGFCCGIVPDSSLGSELDVSSLPKDQLKIARRIASDLLATASESAVLVCVCSTEFNFETTWLGIPYNARVNYRMSREELLANCFGPTGASTISTRESLKVPSLPVEELSKSTISVAGDVSICLMRAEEAYSQKNRTVVTSSGEYRSYTFNYKPQFRVCFDDGDAFFVAKASNVACDNSGSLELNYYVAKRRQYLSITADSGRHILLADHDMRLASDDIPTRQRGMKLTVTDLPRDFNSRFPELLVDSPDREWFVFVMSAKYDQHQYGLGRRYNRLPSDQHENLLRYEFVDCNFCTATYPFGKSDLPWPPSLEVSWRENMAQVSAQEIKLVFVNYWDGVYFYSDGNSIENHQIEFHNGSQIDEWEHGKIIRTFFLEGHTLNTPNQASETTSDPGKPDE